MDSRRVFWTLVFLFRETTGAPANSPLTPEAWVRVSLGLRHVHLAHVRPLDDHRDQALVPVEDVFQLTADVESDLGYTVDVQWIASDDVHHLVLVPARDAWILRGAQLEVRRVGRRPDDQVAALLVGERQLDLAVLAYRRERFGDSRLPAPLLDERLRARDVRDGGVVVLCR
jgi:hypothetical protein